MNGIPTRYFTRPSSIATDRGKSVLMFPLKETYRVPGVIMGIGCAFTSENQSGLPGSEPENKKRKHTETLDTKVQKIY